MTGHDPMAVANPLAPFEKEGMLKIVAPAKTNLFLSVGDTCEDGFHEVVTVMHALSLHDVIHMDYEPQTDGGLTVELQTYTCGGIKAWDIPTEENLVYKAIFLLAEKLGRQEDERFKVRLEKHIPQQAGLGGGSSDAVAALVGAAHFWGIDKRAPEVREAACALGSDLPFFLYGGCAYFSGKGNVLERRLEPMKKPLVLIQPEEGISTKEAYRVFDRDVQPTPPNLLEELEYATKAEDISPYNNLGKAAETIVPELQTIRTWLGEENGIESFFVSGSGSAIVAICENFDVACRASCEAQKRGWWARTASFSSLSAAIVPSHTR